MICMYLLSCFKPHIEASPKKNAKQHLTKESLLSRYGEKLLISVTWMHGCTDFLEIQSQEPIFEARKK